MSRRRGLPLGVRYDDLIWAVEPGIETVQWFSRRERVNGEIFAAFRRGDANRAGNWRGEVRTAALFRLRAFHLQREARWSVWRLFSVTDGDGD